MLYQCKRCGKTDDAKNLNREGTHPHCAAATTHWEATMSDTLKPCPFCGNKAESITVIGAPHVVCTNDQCALWATSAKIPLKEWNTRPAVTDEPADAMLDAGCDAYIQHRVLRSTPAVTVRGIWQAMNAALEKAGDE